MESKTYTLVTHNSRYHADDVFACATLKLVLERQGVSYTIIRTRDEEKIKSGDYVFDIGGEYDPARNRFDHHQKGGAGQRENSIPYASFGLVWKHYGTELTGSEEITRRIDARLVQAVDAGDNAIETFQTIENRPAPYLLHNFLYAFAPTWQESSRTFDDAFMQAVGFAMLLLEREIIQTKDILVAEDELATIYKQTQDKRMLVLDKYYPWENILTRYPEPLVVVVPNTNNKWKAEGVLLQPNSFDRRIYFPASWGGLRDEDLQKVSGVSDAIFCHNGRFMAVADSQEGAIKLAQLALFA